MSRGLTRWYTLLLPLSLALAACGDPAGMDDGDDGGEDPGPMPVADSATMTTFANAAVALVQVSLHSVYSDQHFATPNPFQLPSLVALPPGLEGVLGGHPGAVARVSTACVPVTTGLDTAGLAIDTDVDGTPDDFTADFGAGCTQSDGAGGELTFSGRYELKDIGNGLLDYAYIPDHLAAMIRDTATGHFFRQQVTAHEEAHFSASHASHQIALTREITTWSGGDTVHVLLYTNGASTFDADPGAEFARLGRLPQGTLHFTSEFIRDDVGAGTDSLRFVYTTTTPIHVAFACDTGIDAGQLQGLIEGDVRVGFRYSWEGCVTPALELFGTTP